MSFDDVVEIVKPDQHGQYRLCQCDNCLTDENVVYLKCLSPDGSTVWRVKCLTCGRQTQSRPVKHDAQIYWNGLPWKCRSCRPRTEKGGPYDRSREKAAAKERIFSDHAAPSL